MKYANRNTEIEIQKKKYRKRNTEKRNTEKEIQIEKHSKRNTIIEIQ